MQTAPRNLVLPSCSYFFTPVCIHWLAAPCFPSRHGRLPIGSKVLERMSADCDNDATSHWAATPVPARLRRRALAPTMLGYPHRIKGQKYRTKIALSFIGGPGRASSRLTNHHSRTPSTARFRERSPKAKLCLKRFLLGPGCLRA